ncbi:MAG: hypothetical protein Q9160_006522 [Pyrenula sp. 1 TL-2023]
MANNLPFTNPSTIKQDVSHGSQGRPSASPSANNLVDNGTARRGDGGLWRVEEENKQAGRHADKHRLCDDRINDFLTAPPPWSVWDLRADITHVVGLFGETVLGFQQNYQNHTPVVLHIAVHGHHEQELDQGDIKLENEATPGSQRLYATQNENPSLASQIAQLNEGVWIQVSEVEPADKT